jgi:hypothetical protein
MPLHDLLTERTSLLGPAAPTAASGNKRKTALVPGCGKGHDVLLLASWGYDVVGLDLAETALKEARENAEAVKDSDAYKLQEGVQERGKITWALGDFFADDFLKEAGVENFDLIFDFTVSFSFLFFLSSVFILCSLRMCLEFVLLAINLPIYPKMPYPGPLHVKLLHPIYVHLGLTYNPPILVLLCPPHVSKTKMGRPPSPTPRP